MDNRNLPVQTVATFEDMFLSQEENLTALLPQGTTIDFMKANIIAAIGDNPKLLECTRSSIMQAAFEACELGLMVHSSLGEAWIVPYGTRATFIPGYQGLVKLAFNAGFVANVTSRLVYTNDKFECTYGAGATKGHVFLEENHGNRGALKGVVCIAELTTGADTWEYYTIEKLHHIRSMSASYKAAVKYKNVDKDKIWGDEHNTNEMYRKYVWSNLSKWIPRSGNRYAKAVEISHREFEDDFGYATSARAHLSTHLLDDRPVHDPAAEEDTHDGYEEDAGDIDFITGASGDNGQESQADMFDAADDPVEQFKPAKGYAHPALDKLYELFPNSRPMRINVVHALVDIKIQVFDVADVKDEDMNTVDSLLVRMYNKLVGKKTTPQRVARFLELALSQIDAGVEGWSLRTTRDIDSCVSAFIQHERENA